MELAGERLGGVGAADGVSGDGRRGRGSGGRSVSQRGERNVSDGFAAGGTILPVEFRRKAVQRARPHVLRRGGRVRRAGRWGTALR